MKADTFAKLSDSGIGIFLNFPWNADDRHRPTGDAEAR
jgi:hypothetical protein